MLNAFTPLSRRTWIQAGSLSAAGMTTQSLFGAGKSDSSDGVSSNGIPGGTAKACIMLYMLGGPPQQETFDMKPEAPGSACSLFPTISTNVPGIDLCGLLPNLAVQADRLAIIRSVFHGGNALFHGAGVHYNMTGFPNVPREGEPFLDRRDYPAIGAVLNQLRGTRNGMPASVQLPMWVTQDGPGREWAGQHSGFLGRKYDPLVMDYGYFKLTEDFNLVPPGGEASLPGRLPPGFKLNDDLRGSRLDRRLELQRDLGRNHIADGTVLLRDWNRDRSQALDVLAAESTWKAFSIEDEPPSLLAKYGDNRLGRSCLVARRLVEAGVSFVTVIFGGWDTHSHHVEHTRDRLLPPLNLAYAALLDDLADRAMLDSTLVAWTGEFGRTPNMNGNNTPGRDHWASVYSTVLSGGGIRGGQVYGKSDKLAAEPVDKPVPVADFVATIYHALGYGADTTVVDAFNRPHHILAGRPLVELF